MADMKMMAFIQNFLMCDSVSEGECAYITVLLILLLFSLHFGRE